MVAEAMKLESRIATLLERLTSHAPQQEDLEDLLNVDHEVSEWLARRAEEPNQEHVRPPLT